MTTVTVENIPGTSSEQLKQEAQAHRLDLEKTLARAQALRAQELRERTLACPIDDDAFTQAKAEGRA